jgi:ADP-ribose pyrophosphatase YjhB (NUDIX family)
MDNDEMPEGALLREMREETGLSVQPLRLEGIVPLAGWREMRGILLIYRCRLLAADHSPGSEQVPAAADDVTEARWFTPGEVPWAEIAFESTADLVRKWAAELVGGAG